MRWLIYRLLRGAVAAATLRLAWHVKKCQERQCRHHSDIENCDETSFCKVGNALFVDMFDMIEILARYGA